MNNVAIKIDQEHPNCSKKFWDDFWANLSNCPRECRELLAVDVGQVVVSHPIAMAFWRWTKVDLGWDVAPFLYTERGYTSQAPLCALLTSISVSYASEGITEEDNDVNW